MRKWRLWHLVVSWLTYWVAIIAIKLGGGIAAAWRIATRGPNDGESGINFNWATESGLHLEVTRAGAKVWEGTTSIAAAVGWAAIPPLLLWLLWLWLGANERAKQRELESLPSTPADEIPVKQHVTPIRDRR